MKNGQADKIWVVKLTFVVRRGALRRFDRLKQAAAEVPVDVIWDRRTSHRRRADCTTKTERRVTERRRQPTFTWTLADFVVMEEEEGP